MILHNIMSYAAGNLPVCAARNDGHGGCGTAQVCPDKLNASDTRAQPRSQ